MLRNPSYSDSLKRISHMVPILGCIQFLILSTAAMLFYPGGTKLDSSTSGYLFFLNFFSDLGRTISHSGEPNAISLVFFVITLSLSGLSFIIYFYFLPSFFPSSPQMRRYGDIIQKAGIIGGMGFIAIAFFPSDLVSLLHDAMVVIGFLSVFIASAGLFYITYTSGKFHYGYSVVYFALMILILTYALTTLALFQIKTVESLFLRVTAQKLVVYGMNVCFLIQSVGVFRIQKKNH